MDVLTTKVALRDRLEALRASGRSVGLVPTMGALHAGHLSLLAAARECDVVVLTVFVNPLQFGVGEDLDAYPRPIERDLAVAEEHGADIAFTPTTGEMYPEPMVTTVHVDGLTATLEGATRPTHFDGVTTVVTKLFAIAGPCRAYFGEKDYQQLAVVARMVADLDLPVSVIPCPIVREPDGLALSSRNVYLTDPERVAAGVLHRALQAGVALIEAGERDAGVVRDHMAGIVAREPLARPDYCEVVDATTLAPSTTLVPGTSVRLMVAGGFGVPRLLDNLGLTVP